LIYGAKCSSIAGYLNVPEDIISPLFDKFWQEFAGIKEWQRELIRSYRRRGYVECLTGRRRHAPLSDNRVYNTPVQGTAAEIVMDAMCRLSETGDPELQPELQIHDDLTFLRVPLKRVDIIAEQVIDHMLAVPFDWAHIVPITVEMSVGPNWCEMEEIGSYSSDTWRK
jgi:DNA polymerase-1